MIKTKFILPKYSASWILGKKIYFKPNIYCLKKW